MQQPQEPTIETIAGLTIAPNSDYPFGKPFQMGLAIYTIHDKAIEEGYKAGIQAHWDYITDHENCPPAFLDDAQFTLVLQHFTPSGLTEYQAELWRAHFIAGWMSVALGLVRPAGSISQDEEE